MSSKQNWNNTGEQIKDALSDALRTGDFKELNTLLSDTATSALNEVGKKIEQQFGGSTTSSSDTGDTSAWQQQRQEREQQRQKQQQERQARQQEWAARQQAWAAQQAEIRKQTWAAQHPQAGQQPWAAQQAGQQTQTAQHQTGQQTWAAQQTQAAGNQTQTGQQIQTQPKRPFIKFKKIGNVSNVLYKVFGGIGLGITGLVTLIRTLVFLASTGVETTAGGWIANFIFLAIFFGMIHVGISQGKRLKRAERYVQLCDYRVYGEIEHLAKATDKSNDYVVKDLKKMLRLGIFPEGHLDEQNTCFMLNDEVYRQYLETEQSRKLREQESPAASGGQGNSQTAENHAQEVSAEQQSELDTMMAEGMDCIRKLRDLNDQIPGEAISAKLFHLENLLKDIFDNVKEHPEQMNRMHKLMSYYLPTTLKLVEAYADFDKVSAPGQDIIEAKAEIENTLDTINQAFTELLNNLFQNAVFDATTDAQVLKTMLAREGLMRDMEFATIERNS